MRVTYTPILHAKEGELEALKNTPASLRALILPLFEIGKFTDKIRDQVTYKHRSAPMCAYLEKIADSIGESFPDGPVMLDTNQWALEEATETGEVPIAYAINAVLSRGLDVVPVVGLDRWEFPQYQLALKTLPFDDDIPWVIRLDSSDIEDAADPDHFLGRIDEVIQGLGMLPSRIGILMDFGDVTGKMTEQLQVQADRILQLLGSEGYLFFSIAGCSMPPTINKAVKETNSTAILLRKELYVWEKLKAAYPSLTLVYGDYGVRGPSSSDVQNPHTNGKIRYTIERAFFVARGQSQKIDDGEQMYRLANDVASSKHYQGPDFSWGDAELYRRAIRETTTGPRGGRKTVGPGNSNSWIQFDTNHHVKWVLAEVTAIEQSLSAPPTEMKISRY